MAERNPVIRNGSCLAGIGLILFALVVFGSTKSPGILTNGGFETSAADKAGPIGWSHTRVPHTKDLVAFDWDDQIYHTGSRSVSISIQESHPDDQIDYNWNQPVTGFERDTIYEVTGWIKAQNLKSTVFMVVQCWDSAFTKMLDFATTQQDCPVTGTTDWTQIKTTISIPAETRRVMILAGIRAPDNRGGKAWFDDIRIAPVTSD